MSKIQNIASDILKTASSKGVSPIEISKNIKKMMDDFVKGANGKNGSSDPKHPNLKEIGVITSNIVKESKKLESLDSSTIYLRSGLAY